MWCSYYLHPGCPRSIITKALPFCAVCSATNVTVRLLLRGTKKKIKMSKQTGFANASLSLSRQAEKGAVDPKRRGKKLLFN